MRSNHINSILLKIKNINESEILVDNKNFFIVYKAPKVHSVPGKGKSLVEWLLEKKPELKNISGKEAGLINRLDFETHGLVLFAADNNSYLKFLEDQNKGNIIKKYSALVSSSDKRNSGFPANIENLINIHCPYTIKSYFRPYGPGRMQVRPVEETTDKKYLKKHKIADKIYSTEILDKHLIAENLVEKEIFSLRVCISQGFRHQIRCHLAWLGFPILNDMIYGEHKAGQGLLALRACGIEFNDPESGKILHYKLADRPLL